MDQPAANASALAAIKAFEITPTYQVWMSTDSCNEFWAYEDVAKAEYDAAPEEKRRIIFEVSEEQSARVIASVKACAFLQTSELQDAAFVTADDETPIYELVRDASAT